MYVNEYNVFNWATPTATGTASTSRAIQNADGDPTDGPVSGIGIQAYLGDGGGAFQPSAMQSMNNSRRPGTADSLTEFGVCDTVDRSLLAAKQQVNRNIPDDFRQPRYDFVHVLGLLGRRHELGPGFSILPNTDWSLTDIGKMYEDMLGIHDWGGHSCWRSTVLCSPCFE